jgi:hypothetical protein
VPTLTAGPTGGPTAEPTDGPTDTKKPEATPTPTTTPADDAGGTGFSGGDWAALGAGLWFLLMLLCLLALWWFKWRKGKLPDEGEPEETL